MKISEKLNSGKINISLEVFPPKTSDTYDKVQDAVDKIGALKPAFISVTYGAGGGTSKNTLKIAKHIKDDLGVDSLAHLTCASSTKEEEGGSLPGDDSFKHASELVQEIKKHGDFCIGGACYPEGHVENAHKEDDIRYLKEKVDCGVDFLTTQMFFDNSIHYNFLYRIREAGITVPVLPGIMPVTNGRQMKRICQLSGTILPARFQAIVDRFGDNPAAMQQAGIAYATDQIIDLLANGIKNIHIYSMNKPEVAAAILNNLSEIVKC